MNDYLAKKRLSSLFNRRHSKNTEQITEDIEELTKDAKDIELTEDTKLVENSTLKEEIKTQWEEGKSIPELIKLFNVSTYFLQKVLISYGYKYASRSMSLNNNIDNYTAINMDSKEKRNDDILEDWKVNNLSLKDITIKYMLSDSTVQQILVSKGFSSVTRSLLDTNNYITYNKSFVLDEAKYEEDSNLRSLLIPLIFNLLNDNSRSFSFELCSGQMEFIVDLNNLQEANLFKFFESLGIVKEDNKFIIKDITIIEIILEHLKNKISKHGNRN